jgi:competence ComEA-like helix-hairpin-helix protein
MNPLEFSKRSRRAIFLFLIVFVILAVIPRIIIYYTPEKPIHFSWKEKEIIRNFHPILEEKQVKFHKKTYNTPPHQFDPNTYTVNDWMSLGLSLKQAEAILKFGKYGFKSKEDLLRVFVIPKELMDKMIDSTIYPEKQKTSPSLELKKDIKITSVNINIASEEELLKLKGIGPFFAKNILKKRDQLGGFVQKEQLLEVWKMTPEKLEEVMPFITIDPQAIKKININLATAEEFKKHPYFSWNMANAIVKLRTQHGPFSSINELKMSVVLTDELFLKIKPYLTL